MLHYDWRSSTDRNVSLKLNFLNYEEAHEQHRSGWGVAWAMLRDGKNKQAHDQANVGKLSWIYFINMLVFLASTCAFYNVSWNICRDCLPIASLLQVYAIAHTVFLCLSEGLYGNILSGIDKLAPARMVAVRVGQAGPSRIVNTLPRPQLYTAQCDSNIFHISALVLCIISNL